MLVKLGFAEFIFIALLKSLQKHVPFNVIIEYLNIKYIHIYLFQNWRKIHLPSFEEKKPLQSQGLPEYLKKWCVACHLCLQQSTCKNWLYLGSTTKVSIRQPEHSECPFQQHCLSEHSALAFQPFTHRKWEQDAEKGIWKPGRSPNSENCSSNSQPNAVIHGSKAWPTWTSVKQGQTKVTAKSLFCPVLHSPTFLKRLEF